MSKNSPEVEEKKQIDSISKIETIKNLIFGEDIQQYNSEFETLKKDILEKREELKTLVNDTHQEINTLIDNLSTDINIRITELEAKLEDKVDSLKEDKVDRKTLGNLLVKMGNQISE